MKRTLYLSLKKEAFDVMITGEKKLEFRKQSKWILSRLKNKNYDEIYFKNGYCINSPWFTCEYNGYCLRKVKVFHVYSNGLKVEVGEGGVVIFLGKILKRYTDENKVQL